MNHNNNLEDKAEDKVASWRSRLSDIYKEAKNKLSMGTKPVLKREYVEEIEVDGRSVGSMGSFNPRTPTSGELIIWNESEVNHVYNSLKRFNAGISFTRKNHVILVEVIDQGAFKSFLEARSSRIKEIYRNKARELKRSALKETKEMIKLGLRKTVEYEVKEILEEIFKMFGDIFL